MKKGSESSLFYSLQRLIYKDFGLASFHVANDGCIGKACVGKNLQYLLHGSWGAGHQQATGGLRVRQQSLLCIADRCAQFD